MKKAKFYGPSRIYVVVWFNHNTNNLYTRYYIHLYGKYVGAYNSFGHRIVYISLFMHKGKHVYNVAPDILFFD